MTSFASRLRAGHPLTGALVRMPAEPLVELCGLAGLDFVVIDAEHGAGDAIALQQHLTAAQAGGAAVVVRVGDATDARRALDLGADGLLLPHVGSADEARDIMADLLYPPLGRRGFAAYTRAARYGLRTGPEHHSAEQPVVIAMIEDPGAVIAAASIAAVPGIDGLMVGPADLAVELGSAGATHPDVERALGDVRRACRDAGLASVSIVSTREQAEVHRAEGTQVVMHNLQAAITDLVRGLVPGPAAAAGPPEPLLVLSGMLGDASAWDDVASLLGDEVHVQHARIDLDDTVVDMARTVLASAPPRFAIAGHSLGGIVAMEVVRQAPLRVSRLAVLNASGTAGTDAQVAAWSALRERVAAGRIDDVIAELAASTLPAEHRSDELVARNAAMGRTVGAAGLDRQLAAQITRPRALDHLGAVRVPTLLVSGALDEVSPPNLQAELAAAIPGAEHEIVPDCGHMTLLERPDRVAELLRRWLGRP